MSLFKDFTDKELEIFAEMDHIVMEYKRGENIINEGDDSSMIYLILRGSVMIVKKVNGHTIRLAKLKPGEIFGEMSFFSKKSRRSDAIAGDDAMVLRMDEDFFEKVKPEIKDKVKNYFIELLVNRLDAMNESLVSVSRLMRT
jgi:serine/threonine-protein kinase